MRTPCLLCSAALLLVPSPAGAADLSKIDRSIKKEPRYKSSPRYCLLVFGPEAKARVWLVVDGATLYVDRNANGDLTEEGEKVRAEKDERAAAGNYTFKAGDVRDGKRLHKTLTVFVDKIDHLAKRDETVKALLAKHPKARGYTVGAEVEVPGWKGSGVGGRVGEETFHLDGSGVLQFADRPQDAPIIHFGGPLQVTLFGSHRLTAGRSTDLFLGVGTPGVGPGTTAWVEYQGFIPEKAHPTVEVVYPSKEPGGSPVRERYALKERC
jgi:hypothetical protein